MIRRSHSASVYVDTFNLCGLIKALFALPIEHESPPSEEGGGYPISGDKFLYHSVASSSGFSRLFPLCHPSICRALLLF